MKKKPQTDAIEKKQNDSATRPELLVILRDFSIEKNFKLNFI
jgi:hypothetical protein